MFSWTVVSLVLLTSIANLVGGLIVVRKEWSPKALTYLMAFSAGFLLSIGILDLMPEGLENSPENGIYILIGFLVLFAFQRILTTHFHFGYETHEDKLSKKMGGLGAFIGMTIHSFFDGVSIVAGFEVSSELGFLVFVAVLLHKIPDGLTISSIVLVVFNDRKKAFIASAVLALATIFGGALVWLLSDTEFAAEVLGDSFARIALSFSAGVFLYVAATDLLPVVNQSENRKTGLYVLLGVAVFYIASWIIGVVGLE
ncbi:ZIP family metal transporter [Staphylococcus epidermidis]|uniref:ZIP family metal transporter n=1 Tax=Staphylococcus epidermidis TaxID=1282 RepID=UPI001432F47C|nr:ZIP family metal transporter [Staphylococcus epidermidis]NKD36490.1 ZIP family metal transporter [Staphylococcus epidermidis]